MINISLENKSIPKEQSQFVNPLSENDIIERKAQRKTVTCACKGEVEDCIRCYGKGYYVIDGFGNKV